MHNKRTHLSIAPSQEPEMQTLVKEPHLSVFSPHISYQPVPVDEAATYIADLLDSLQAVALSAKLEVLSDLIHVAKEEARLNSI